MEESKKVNVQKEIALPLHSVWVQWFPGLLAGHGTVERGIQAPLSPPSPQVSVYLQNWSHVLSYVSKAESTPEIAEVLPRPATPEHT